MTPATMNRLREGLTWTGPMPSGSADTRNRAEAPITGDERIAYVQASFETFTCPQANFGRDYWRCVILYWIATNPGKDAVDVARHFDIDLKLAVDVLDDLSAQGILRDE